MIALPLIALALWLIGVNYVFVIRDVQATGSTSVPDAQVVHLAEVQLGARMGRLNVERIRQNVESDGRLALVSVTRRYPSTVLITVRDRTSDALILQAGKIVVLDSDGYVVSVSDRLPQKSVPYVTGLRPSTFQLGRQLDVADGRLKAMKAVLEALKELRATDKVAELSLESTRDLRIITRSGVTVLLGSAENMHNKIVWMTGTLADIEARGEARGQLDVSSGNKADFRSGATPTPVPTATPEPEDVLGYDALETPLPEWGSDAPQEDFGDADDSYEAADVFGDADVDPDEELDEEDAAFISEMESLGAG